MTWNPETYNRFKSDRYIPFYDCLKLIEVQDGLNVLDLGCGTGELTGLLADRLPNASILGVDSSAEMLAGAEKYVREGLRFELRSIEEQVKLPERWNLVFSNAALQWVDNHESLLPALIKLLKPGGQLVVQMPDQHNNISNILLNELADTEPFKTALQGWKRVSSVLDIDQYSRLLFENGSKQMTVFEKIYPLVLNDADALFDWVSGTALIPYTERLSGENRDAFLTAYRELLHNRFPQKPLFYPFRRILFEARF